jgi:hypothetical protein
MLNANTTGKNNEGQERHTIHKTSFISLVLGIQTNAESDIDTMNRLRTQQAEHALEKKPQFNDLN